MLPVTPKNRENGLVDNEVRTFVSHGSSPFRLTPEINANWKAYAGKVGIEHPEVAIAWNKSEMAAVNASQIDLPLPTDDPAVPIEKHGCVESPIPSILDKTRCYVATKLSRHICQSPFSGPGEIFRQARHVHILASTFFQKSDGMADIARIIHFRIRFRLNEGNSNSFFHTLVLWVGISDLEKRNTSPHAIE